jgi:hypothetical protein
MEDHNPQYLFGTGGTPLRFDGLKKVFLTCFLASIAAGSFSTGLAFAELTEKINARISSNGGAEGGVPASITITLDSYNSNPTPLTFNLTVNGGDASEDIDYSGLVGVQAVIAAGGRATTLVIPVYDDLLNEGRENITIEVSPLNDAIKIANPHLDLALFDNDEKREPVASIVPILHKQHPQPPAVRLNSLQRAMA